MSERKVLNKYYPPDFDPAKIPRLKLPKDRQYTVRLMAPCNMRCRTCGEYIYKGKKFNARKETVSNEEYLGIKIFRFYIKCPRCLAEITFKTDPECADYVVEHGASRNFQALKLAEEAAEREAKEIEEEEKSNPMKLLENRTKASKNEMESLEALEEIKDMNERNAKVKIEQLLMQNHMKLLEEQKNQEEEDEAFIRSVFLTSDGEKVKRITDEDSSCREIQFVKPKLESSGLAGSLCSGSSETLPSEDPPPKKMKLADPVSNSSSRQRSLDMLRKAVKPKKSHCDTVAIATVQYRQTDLYKNHTSCIQDEKTSLNLLSAYSDSDSESS